MNRLYSPCGLKRGLVAAGVFILVWLGWVAGYTSAQLGDLSVDSLTTQRHPSVSLEIKLVPYQSNFN